MLVEHSVCHEPISVLINVYIYIADYILKIAVRHETLIIKLSVFISHLRNIYIYINLIPDIRIYNKIFHNF